MTRANKKVGYLPAGKNRDISRTDAAEATGKILKLLEGRWKLIILFQLFGGRVLRFSELEKAIPGVSQKMLIQQLRQMERDGMIRRIVYPEVPPKVEYSLTPWGQALCPTLDSLLTWASQRAEMDGSDTSTAAPADSE